MLAELNPDGERAGEQSHCFYKTIDAFNGYLYSQPRSTFPLPPREASKRRNLQHNQNPP